MSADEAADLQIVGDRIGRSGPGHGREMSKAPTGNAVKDFHGGNDCDSATKWPQHLAVGETHGRAEPD